MSVKSGRPPPRSMDGAIGSPQTPIGSQAGLGLQAIYRACNQLYPDQPSPLQVTALRKFWMGGPDPLDYIYMFSNAGSAEGHSPAHWHYVTNGLSDLYGDSRLHNCSASTDSPSGFGFELTFRLRKVPGEKGPPTWPAHLLQSLARYVFRSQAQLLPGDHIPWHCPLEQLLPTNNGGGGGGGGTTSQRSPNTTGNTTLQQQQQSVAMAAVAAAASLIAAQTNQSAEPIDPATYSSALVAALSAARAEYAKRAQDKQRQQKNTIEAEVSKIRHMLVVDDPQLGKINTPFGWVKFLQIVGLCDEELRLVQRWTGGQVADILRQHGTDTGGELLVTDLRRNKTIFELDPGLADCINERMRREGSNLSGVTTQFFAWAAIEPLQLAEILPGESEASISQASQVVAMETDDSSSVSTLHQTPSSVTTQNASVSKNDDDVVAAASTAGDSSVCSSGAPIAKTAKHDDAAAIDAEMRIDVKQPQGFITVEEEHEPSSQDRGKNFRTQDGNSSITADAKSFSSSSLNLLSEMRPRKTGNSVSSVGGLGGVSIAPLSQCGSSSVPGTPGSLIGGSVDSAPCTPLAHLSLSPASLEMHPSRAIDCLDIHFSLEAGELLPLAICDRLKHGRHFTFLNAHSPEHAITFVPPGVTGAMVSPDVPYVSRGPWLQIYLQRDFLELLERQFSILQHPEDVVLPHVFRWPERRLRICVLDASSAQPHLPVSSPSFAVPRALPVSAPAFTTTSPIPAGLFPPGCVPPPPVLAAFINSQHGRGGQLVPTSLSGCSVQRSQSPPAVPSFPIGKPSPSSAPHLPSPSFPGAPSSYPAFMEAMLSSLSCLYGNKGPFGSGFVSPFSSNPPPPPPTNTHPPW